MVVNVIEHEGARHGDRRQLDQCGSTLGEAPGGGELGVIKISGDGLHAGERSVERFEQRVDGIESRFIVFHVI